MAGGSVAGSASQAGLERLGDLLRNRQRIVDPDRSTRDSLRQVLAFDQFHHQSGHVRAALEPENLRDVGMIQRRQDFRLALKAGEAVRIGGDRRGQHLQGDLALQVGIGGPIHLSHPALAEQ
jgi:hypothetical protein